MSRPLAQSSDTVTGSWIGRDTFAFWTFMLMHMAWVSCHRYNAYAQLHTVKIEMARTNTEGELACLRNLAFSVVKT